MNRLLLIALVLAMSAPCLPAAGLQSGPMLGYSTMAEAMIWVQTDGPAEVVVSYWEEGHGDRIMRTDPVKTGKHTGYVAKCIADQVSAGTRYGYSVFIDGREVQPQFREGYREGSIPLSFHTPPNWRFRESGHQPVDFTMGFGSCAYINEEGGYDRLNGDPYGRDYQIFESVYEVAPAFFIWLGDNIYYREPDWSSRTGMIHRWTHDRSIPELRPMLATIPQYSIWDDHDYGPNNIGRFYWNKAEGTEVFRLFSGNPTAGLPELPGIFTYFAWGDVHFYLLDNRTYRTPRGLKPEDFGYAAQQFGKDQVDWLIEMMKYNQVESESPTSSYPCTFHVIASGSQVISPYDKDSLHTSPEEWEYLFDRLAAEEIHNVIFLTGDVHFAEASRMDYKGIEFWDLTASPMTAGPWAGSPAEENPYRVDLFPGEADRYGARNFATLTFEGPLSERRAVIRYYDSNGRLLNQDPGKAPGEVTGASVIRARELNLSN